MADPTTPGRIVRLATREDALAIRRILDAAILAYDDLDARIESDGVLVATADDGTITGSLVLDPDPSTAVTGWDDLDTLVGESAAESGADGAHIDAVAVRQRRRDRGIGRALVERALEREGWLTAHFDASVRPFYDALGFEVRALEADRFAGVGRQR